MATKQAQQLDRAAVAARLGVQLKTVDVYRQRPEMAFPEPDGYIGRSPWWRASSIDRWDRGRQKLPANRVNGHAGQEAAPEPAAAASA